MHSQTGSVGINTTSPNGATILDINSNQKGILIPRLSDTERDTNLADNNIATVPPASGMPNQALSKGTLIFNTTTNAFQYWDGVLWKQFFVTNNSLAGNDGVVKINSGAGGVKPTYTLGASGSGYGTAEHLTYVTPLVFAPAPTTNWPENTVPYPGVTSNIYYESSPATLTNQRWRENITEGQVHVWRLIATVTPNSNSAGSIRGTFINPDSGFKVTSIQEIPKGSGIGNTVTLYFYTIADSNSLDTGKGYQLKLQSDITCDVVVESFTRISLFKD